MLFAKILEREYLEASPLFKHYLNKKTLPYLMINHKLIAAFYLYQHAYMGASLSSTIKHFKQAHQQIPAAQRSHPSIQKINAYLGSPLKIECQSNLSSYLAAITHTENTQFMKIYLKNLKNGKNDDFDDLLMSVKLNEFQDILKLAQTEKFNWAYVSGRILLKKVQKCVNQGSSNLSELFVILKDIRRCGIRGTTSYPYLFVDALALINEERPKGFKLQNQEPMEMLWLFCLAQLCKKNDIKKFKQLYSLMQKKTSPLGSLCIYQLCLKIERSLQQKILQNPSSIEAMASFSKKLQILKKTHESISLRKINKKQLDIKHFLQLFSVCQDILDHQIRRYCNQQLNKCIQNPLIVWDIKELRGMLNLSKQLNNEKAKKVIQSFLQKHHPEIKTN